MSVKKAGDLMVSIDQYPIVDSSATVLDAVIRLEESRRISDSDKHPYRAVLVADKKGKIVGKLGQRALLLALEPRSHVVDDQDTLEKAGVSDAIMETALRHSRVLQRELSEMCISAATLPVRFVMLPFKEHIDIETPICEVIHKILAWQTLSVLITENDQPIGLVRLVDLCDEVIKQMRDMAAEANIED